MERALKEAMLKDEYLFLQSQYEDFDRRSLSIKGWVSGGAIAALALSFSSSHSLTIFIPFFIAVVVVTVWYLEAHWKLFQYALSDRIRIIEAYFRGDESILHKDPVPFQIYHWWFKSYVHDEPIYGYETHRPRNRTARLKSAAFQRFVLLPYAPIFILCLVTVPVLWLNK